MQSIVVENPLARAVPEAIYVNVPALAEWLRVCGVSQRQAALALGVTPQLVQHWVKTSARLSGARINRIAALLGVPATILVMHRPWDDEALEYAKRAALTIEPGYAYRRIRRDEIAS